MWPLSQFWILISLCLFLPTSTTAQHYEHYSGYRKQHNKQQINWCLQVLWVSHKSFRGFLGCKKRAHIQMASFVFHFSAHANVSMWNTQSLETKLNRKRKKKLFVWFVNSSDCRLKDSQTETCQKKKRWECTHHYQRNDFTQCFTSPLSTDKIECWVQINCLCAVIVLPQNGFYQNHYLMAEKFRLKLAQLPTTHSYSVSWKLKWPTSIFLPHPRLPHCHYS